jgi:OMF family outer membrane factor
MKSIRLLLSMTMSHPLNLRLWRSLMTLGTSVVLMLPFNWTANAQTAPSLAPAPWSKTKKANPLVGGSSLDTLLLPNSQFDEKILKDSPLQNSLSQELDSDISLLLAKSLDKTPSSDKRTNLIQDLKNKPRTTPDTPSELSQSTPTNTPSPDKAPAPSDVPSPAESPSPFPTPDPLSPSAQPATFPAPTSQDSLQLPKNPAPNNLNSSGNPLLFPTKAKEVDTNIRQAITLNQAIELALKNNIDLQQANISLEVQQANLESARSALFPTLDTQFQFSRDSSASTELNNALITANNQTLLPQFQSSLQNEQSTNAEGTVQLTYNIYTGGERAAQIAKAEKLVQNSRLQIEVIAEQTRFDATDRYYALQGTDAQVAIAQASVEDASQSLRDARLLEQAGLGTLFDVLRAEGDLATANEALTRAIADQRNARRKLAQILGVGQQVELTAADEITEAGNWNMPLDQTIVQAYKNRAELEQQLLQIEINEQDSYIALASIKPKVDFLADYTYQNNFDNSVGVVDGYSFAAKVTWRFFDGGRAFAEARKAYRQMDLAQSEFAKQRDQIRYDVEQSYYNLISNKDNISSTRTNVRRFEEALRLARLRFQAGVGTQTDVINAQRDLANARGRFLQAIIGYNQSLNSLQRFVSNLPDNNLFEVRP